MNIPRQDMIGIGCAFAGAAIGAFVAVPVFGGTQTQNEADFARAPRDHDEADR